LKCLIAMSSVMAWISMSRAETSRPFTRFDHDGH
jgi:hypothetical protein